MKVSVGIILVSIFSLLACESYNDLDVDPVGIDKVIVPDEFDFEMDKTVSLSLTATDAYGNVYPQLVWFLFDDLPEDGGSLIQYVAANPDGTYHGDINLANTYDSVFIGTNYAGIAGEFFQIAENSIEYHFTGQSLPGFMSMKSGMSGDDPIITNGFDDDMEGWKAYRDNGTYSSLFSDHELTPIEGPEGSGDGFIWGFDTKGGMRSWEAPSVYHTNLYGYYLKYDYYIGNTKKVASTASNLPDVRITDGSNVLSVDLTPTFPHRVNGGWQTLFIKLDETATNGTGWRFASGLSTWTTGTGSRSLGRTEATTEQITNIMQNITGILMAPESQVGYYNTKGPEFIALDNVNIIASMGGSGGQTQQSQSSDNDDDGIANDLDDYPDDPDKAFNSYYPSEILHGTLAFEDLWPSAGDYDFNDLVIGYRFNHIRNAANLITQVDIRVVLRAIGGSIRNGFGIQLDLPASKVSMVTSDFSFDADNLTINELGLESGHDKATIICFNDPYKVLTHPGSGTGVNTDPEYTYVAPDTIRISIKLNQPVTIQELGNAPNNPFIFRTDERGREVHLPGYKPTNLADQSYFGTQDDNTNPDYNYYYRTSRGLPWAMNLPIEFKYPTEKTPISDGYLKFVQWAQSGGFSFMDWYLDVDGYRDETALY